MPHEAGHHAHESPPAMTVPLMILAVLRAGRRGLFRVDATASPTSWCSTPSLAYRDAAGRGRRAGTRRTCDVALISTVVALSGIGLAAFFYLGDPAPGRRGSPDAVGPLYRLVVRQVLHRPDLQRAVRLAAVAAGRS